MRVVLARTAGFCIGVKRALEMVLEAINETPTQIYTYGPLIHNPQVLELLRERGITVLKPGDAVPQGLVVIRAHGIPPRERRQLEGGASRIIDATCPRVAKVQAIIRRWAAKGHATIIVGDADHPEVEGLLGYTGGRGHVVAKAREVAALPELGAPIVVAQTTQSEALFEERVGEIKARFPGAHIFNTICDATAFRQAEVQELARHAEALVVVGGRNSGNTQRLVEISRATGIPTYHVETEQELDLEEMSRYHTVGVTAGASTPHWLIGNVVSTLKHAWAFRPGSWTNYLYRAWRFFLKSNLFVATGAGSLSYVSSLLQQVEPQFKYFFVAFFYVYAMHLLHHFTDKASKLNDPVQTMFYGRHRMFLAEHRGHLRRPGPGPGRLSGLAALCLHRCHERHRPRLQFQDHPGLLGPGHPDHHPQGDSRLQGGVHRGGLGGPGGPDSGGLLRHQTRGLRGHRHRLLFRGGHDLHPLRPL